MWRRTFGTEPLQDLEGGAALLLVQNRHHGVGRMGHDGTEHASCRGERTSCASEVAPPAVSLNTSTQNADPEKNTSFLTNKHKLRVSDVRHSEALGMEKSDEFD